ncbi:hypothetical protein LZ31DRAFT_187954 [Colletotrichum somersetense]|nr:hypothetical protein LZ31DRAFT_187954 [Colletotrichum somersetense]
MSSAGLPSSTAMITPATSPSHPRARVVRGATRGTRRVAQPSLLSSVVGIHTDTFTPKGNRLSGVPGQGGRVSGLGESRTSLGSTSLGHGSFSLPSCPTQSPNPVPRPSVANYVDDDDMGGRFGEDIHTLLVHYRRRTASRTMPSPRGTPTRACCRLLNINASSVEKQFTAQLCTKQSSTTCPQKRGLEMSAAAGSPAIPRFFYRNALQLVSDQGSSERLGNEKKKIKTKFRLN